MWSNDNGVMSWDGALKANLFKGAFMGDTCPIVTVAANDSSALAKNKANYICDGAADDVEINAAISSITGGAVLLLAGTYDITSPILLKGGITLSGENMYTTILKSSTGYADNTIEWEPTTDEYFAEVSNLMIDGDDQGTGYPGNYGIKCTNDNGGTPKDFRVNNVFIFKCKGVGIYGDACWGWRITNSITEYCASCGIILAGGGQSVINGCFSAYNSGAYGIWIQSNTNNDIVTNTCVYQNQQYGLLFEGDDGVVIGNTFDGNGNLAARKNIWLTSAASNCIVVGNKFNKNSGNTTIAASIQNDGVRNLIGYNSNILPYDGPPLQATSLAQISGGLIVSVA